MLFSQTVEYALRAAVWLASRPDEPQTNPQIADATKVPAGYLFKVLQTLSRAGLVHGQRGVGGGFTLTRPADEITILEIVQAIEPIGRIDSCPLGIEAHGKRLCSLHRKLDEAAASIEDAFDKTSLADLLKPGRASDPLCSQRGLLHDISVKTSS